MKVISDGLFSICVYSNEVFNSHHLPHFHVIWADGSCVIALPTLTQIVGKKLPKQAKKLISDNYDAICSSWVKLNSKGNN
jgi:hypothetical protein